MTKEEFKQALEERYVCHSSLMESGNTPKEYWPTTFLSDDVFNFTLYDGDVEKEWAIAMLRVLDCILKKQTFEFQGLSEDNYHTYLAMVNMPFMKGMLSWGGSVRGAWFETCYEKEFKVCCGDITFTSKELPTFVEALLEWAKEHGVDHDQEATGHPS